LPDQWLLVGNGRGDISHEKFRAHVHDALVEFGPQPRPAEWDVAGPLLSRPPKVYPYAPGSWGPAQARELIAPGRWLLGQ
jgi:hypothetical protein